MGGWVCVCVCVVLVGVNKSGGTKAHRSRSALKSMLAEQELSVLLRHGSLPPNKKKTKKQKVPVCWNKRGRTDWTPNSSDNHWARNKLPPTHPPCLFCPVMRTSPGLSMKAQWRSPAISILLRKSTVDVMSASTMCGRVSAGSGRSSGYRQKHLPAGTTKIFIRQDSGEEHLTLMLPVQLVTCWTCQLSAALGLTFADWLNGDGVSSDPGVVNLQRHQCVVVI